MGIEPIYLIDEYVGQHAKNDRPSLTVCSCRCDSYLNIARFPISGQAEHAVLVCSFSDGGEGAESFHAYIFKFGPT